MRRKLRVYLDELRWSRAVTTDLNSWFRLTVATLLFHGANGARLSRIPRRPAVRHRIKLREKELDFWLRTFSGDLFVLYEVLMHKTYQLPVGLDPSVIVDLGAHVGLTTAYFAGQFPGATFVCVEPDPENVELLKLNTSFLRGRVTVIDGAVGSRSGNRHFQKSAWSWSGCLSDKNGTGDVTCYSMEEIMKIRNIEHVDILKVDVEGAESELFNGGPKWLGKVSCILIELHGGYSFEDFRSDVERKGFTVVPPNEAIGNRITLALSENLVKRLNMSSAG